MLKMGCKMKVKDVIRQLSINYYPDDVIATLVISVDDVKIQADKGSLTLTGEELVKIVEKIDEKIDCGLDIEWSLIDVCTDEVIE